MKHPAFLLATVLLLSAARAEADDAKQQLPPGITAPAPANPHVVNLDDYPTISRAMHEEGIVTLGITVTEDGHATDAQVVKSSGFPGSIRQPPRW